MKRYARRTIWTIAATTLVLTQSSALADWATEVIGDNPLNWYRFDELSGTVANDWGSGHLPGTYTGSVTLGSQGPMGSAVAFNGAGHVFLGGTNLPTLWTVEAIFKADTVNGDVSMGLVGADFAATSGRSAIKAEQWNSTGQLGYTVFGVVDVTFTNSLAATPADFKHVIFVAENSGVSLYVNGALAGTDTTTTSLSRWALGASAVRADGTLVDPLTGVIDELVIYDRALSPEEIATHFGAIPVPEPTAFSLALLGGLVAWSMRRRS